MGKRQGDQSRIQASFDMQLIDRFKQESIGRHLALLSLSIQYNSSMIFQQKKTRRKRKGGFGTGTRCM